MNEKDVESRFGYYSIGEGEEVRLLSHSGRFRVLVC